jgi:hypothetical protein
LKRDGGRKSIDLIDVRYTYLVEKTARVWSD